MVAGASSFECLSTWEVKLLLNADSRVHSHINEENYVCTYFVRLFVYSDSLMYFACEILFVKIILHFEPVIDSWLVTPPPPKKK